MKPPPLLLDPSVPPAPQLAAGEWAARLGRGLALGCEDLTCWAQGCRL